jgi:molecular chaperone GrpE
MILGQFKDIMASLGVTEIDAEVGEKFNPAMPEAVMHVEDEALGEGEIAELFQKGFKLGDKVLRCSVVKVAN